MYRLIPLAFIIVLAGCANWFGEAETPAQKSYRAAAVLAYLQIPMKVYVTNPAADPAHVERVKRIGSAAVVAVGEARAALDAGGDTTAAVAFAASTVADLSLTIIGSATPQGNADLARKTVVLATVGARSIGEMRIFRQTFIQPKLEGFVAGNRDPSQEEWDTITALVDANHAAIQGNVPE